MNIEETEDGIVVDEAPDSPPQGQGAEDKPDSDTTTDKRTEEPDWDALGIPEESRDTYKNKSEGELAKMHYNLSSKLGEQGKELSELRQIRKDLDAMREREAKRDQNMTMDEIVETSSADKLRQMYLQQKREMQQLEPDSDEYAEAQQVLDNLQLDYQRKVAQESAWQSANEENNVRFQQEQEKRLQEMGVDISEDEMENLHDIARQEAEIHNKGRLNDAAYEHAMLEALGRDRYVKFYELRGEQRAREKSRQAETKKNLVQEASGLGKGEKRTPFKNLSYKDQQATLKNMNDEELDSFIKMAMNQKSGAS